MKGCLVRLLILTVVLAGAVVLLVFGSFYLTRTEPGTVFQYAMNRVIDRIDRPLSESQTTTLFTIEKGESTTQIADRLEKKGLINNATLFRLLATYYGVTSSLEAGDYELKPEMTSTEIISRLHRGLVKTVTVTIPEGWRAEQMAAILEKDGVFGFSQYMSEVGSSQFDYSFLKSRPKGASLEGYLFPDTYNIQPKMTAKEFVDLQLRTFESRVSSVPQNQAPPQGLIMHQVVTLASIVERETAVPSERALIAGVYLNRLKQGMLLQADPTVQYALTIDPTNVQRYGYWKKGLLLSDLKMESPYNTYKYKGLPPGPIANPGLESIKAVLSPVTTDYLFFVARPDGSHAFARTLDEHNANVRKYGS